MSDYTDKLEEIKERRTDCLNSIASSILDKNEAISKDAVNNRYLFGDSQNTYGIFRLLDLYQKERYYEKYIQYQLTELTQSNIESGINQDLAEINSITAPETNDATIYKMTKNGYYKVNKDYDISINYGNQGTSATEKPMNYSLFYNNWERDTYKYVSQYPLDDLGETYVVSSPPSITLSGSATSAQISDAIKTRSGNSGIYTFWGSTNAIYNIIHTSDPQEGILSTTITFRDDYKKVWAWRTSADSPETSSGHYTKYPYDNDTMCNQFLTNVNSVKNHLNYLIDILGQILTIYTYAENSEYWTEILGSISENKTNLNAYISTFARVRDEISADYDVLNNSTKVQAYGSSLPSSLTSLNNAITRIDSNCRTTLKNIIDERMSTTSANMGTLTSGLRKWINFWLTEKISLENGSFSQIYYLKDSIRSEQKELEKQDKRIKEVTSSDNHYLIPTPIVRAAYSSPKFDRKSGATTQRRIGVIWDGQFAAKKYTVLRKNIKAFDFVHTDSPFYFKNDDWTRMMLENDPSQPAQKGNNKKDLTLPRDADETNGFLKTEYLENIEDDETYIYRVFEEDSNTGSTVDLSSLTRIENLWDPYLNDSSPVKSNQSKVYDDDKVYRFSYIKNGVINISNHQFKKGNFILIISDTELPDYDTKKITINGIHRIIDTSEDSIVLDNLPETIYPGKFYPVFGAVTTKNIPFINYENSELVSATDSIYSNEPAAEFGDLYVRRDGTYDLTGNWNAGNYTIINRRFEGNEFNLNGIEFPNEGAAAGDVMRIDEEGNFQFDNLDDKQTATIISDVNPGIYDEGELGQFWLNTVSQQLFQLVSIEDGIYYWKNLSSTGMIRGDTYIHIQSVPFTTWVISHDLGKFPSVTLVNDDNIEIEGNVKYESELRIVVTFTKPQSGKAFLNWGKTMTREYTFTNTTQKVINNYFDEQDFNKIYPSVTIVNTLGEIIEGKVEYDDDKIITVTFSKPTSGTIYLN